LEKLKLGVIAATPPILVLIELGRNFMLLSLMEGKGLWAFVLLIAGLLQIQKYMIFSRFSAKSSTIPNAS